MFGGGVVTLVVLEESDVVEMGKHGGVVGGEGLLLCGDIGGEEGFEGLELVGL